MFDAGSMSGIEISKYDESIEKKAESGIFGAPFSIVVSKEDTLLFDYGKRFLASKPSPNYLLKEKRKYATNARFRPKLHIL